MERNPTQVSAQTRIAINKLYVAINILSESEKELINAIPIPPTDTKVEVIEYRPIEQISFRKE